MRENQGEECHSARLPNSELVVPLDPSLVLNPLLLCVKGGEPQMTVTHPFIQHMKPVMMYTNDARTASSNVECHHGLHAWEQLAGDGWQETGYAHSLQAYECQPIQN